MAVAVRRWLGRLGVRALFVEPGSPWKNGHIASFNGKLRDQLMNRVHFDTLKEAKVIVERWGRHDNAVRPHPSLGYRAPALESIAPASTPVFAPLSLPRKRSGSALVPFL